MAKFRQTPLVVDAWKASELIRAARDNWRYLPPEIAEAYENGGWVFYADHISIPAFDRALLADREDWIVRGVDGAFYPCKPEVFAKSYEGVAA